MLEIAYMQTEGNLFAIIQRRYLFQVSSARILSIYVLRRRLGL